MLIGGGINPSDQPPIWWMGSDVLTGGPIGPSGPWSNGYGAALPVVTRATALITGPLTAAPFRVMELGFGGRPLGRPRWVTDPMMLRVDRRLTDDVFPEAAKLSRSAFYSSLIRDACWFGTGAFLAQEDETGQPLAGTMRIVHPLLLSCERSTDDNSLRWVIGSDGAAVEDRVVFDRDGYVQLGPIRYRLTALRNPHSPVDVDGHSMGVFEMSPDAFRLGSQITSFESGTFRSGVPAGFLKVDSTMNSMTQEQADELKRNWMAAHGGDRRSIAVLNSFTSFTPLNMSPVDAALGESKRLNIADVAFAFGLSPETLGVTMMNSAVYQTVVEAWSNHRDFGLAPWQAAVEDTLTALLPGTQGVKIDLDRFANPPLKERVETGKLAVEAGLITVNEWREEQGYPPLPEPTPVPVPELAPSPVPVEPTDIRSKRPVALR